ncbi:hypothetical protein BDV19DRAFT_383852 [Aspergillus venezuelensis]
MEGTKPTVQFLDPNRFPAASHLPRHKNTSEKPPKYHALRSIFVGQLLTVQKWTPEGYHTRLLVQDKKGERLTIGLSFPQDSRGSMIISCLEGGQTVLILDANIQNLLSNQPGIEVRDVNRIKVLPLDIRSFSRLNKIFVECNTFQEGLACYGCKRRFHPNDKRGLNACRQCSLVSICRKCRKKGIAEMGHQEDCAVLSDPDIRAMLTADWDLFEGGFRGAYLGDPGSTR